MKIWYTTRRDYLCVFYWLKEVNVFQRHMRGVVRCRTFFGKLRVTPIATNVCASTIQNEMIRKSSAPFFGKRAHPDRQFIQHKASPIWY